MLFYVVGKSRSLFFFFLLSLKKYLGMQNNRRKSVEMYSTNAECEFSYWGVVGWWLVTNDTRKLEWADNASCIYSKDCWTINKVLIKSGGGKTLRGKWHLGHVLLWVGWWRIHHEMNEDQHKHTQKVIHHPRIFHTLSLGGWENEYTESGKTHLPTTLPLKYSWWMEFLIELFPPPHKIFPNFSRIFLAFFF